MTDAVKYEKKDAIALIGMNRPEKRNALSIEMARDLVEALKDAENDPDIKAVIISGEGKIFSAEIGRAHV